MPVIDNPENALARTIAKLGWLSRRQAAETVKCGAVLINGKVENNPARRLMDGDLIQWQKLSVTFGEHLRNHPLRYYMLNKPVGWTCSNRDCHAERLAVDLLPNEAGVRLFSAGRLDRDSDGLIIFSNDGEFVQRLTHPGGGIIKRYQVWINHALPAGAIDEMKQGIPDMDETLKIINGCQVKRNSYILWLGEGRKREIRRLIRHFGCQTMRLKRLAIGALELGSLPVGKYKLLSKKEVNAALSVAVRTDVVLQNVNTVE